MCSEICHASLSVAEDVLIFRVAVYFGDAPRQGQVITSFEEWDVADTTEKPLGFHRSHSPSGQLSAFDLVSTQSGIAAFSLCRSKAVGGGGVLWAIWQLDHNRWQLAIRAIQRAFREHRTAQNVSIIKAQLSLINPLTRHDPLHFVGIPD